jgi:hypothetical protein
MYEHMLDKTEIKGDIYILADNFDQSHMMHDCQTAHVTSLQPTNNGSKSSELRQTHSLSLGSTLPLLTYMQTFQFASCSPVTSVTVTVSTHQESFSLCIN